MEIINTNKEARVEMGDLVCIKFELNTGYYIVAVDRVEQVFSLVAPSGFVAYRGFKSIEELQRETKCVLVAKNKDLKLSF